MNMKLWYNRPSEAWLNGLPIGNGRLAAMVRSAERSDILSLNHEWLWRARNRQRDNITGAAKLADIRTLMQQGDFFRATALANTWLGGLGGISGLPGRVDAYQPAADLSLELLAEDIRFESRSLDLTDGVAQSKRCFMTPEGQSAAVTNLVIAHQQERRILMHCRGTHPFSACLSLSRTEDPELQTGLHISPRRMRFSGVFQEPLSYVVQIDLDTNGTTRVQDDRLVISGADELLLTINIATSVQDLQAEMASWPDLAACRDWPVLLDGHRRSFSQYMNRLSVKLDQPESPLPTDERIVALREGASDEQLLLLAAHFGRYLLIASTLGGELPANLQGKWNHEIHPPWDCDYHLDINLQMNYWAAEPAGLPECARVLLDYIERLGVHGRKAARDLYGCRGLWLPIQTDAWGRATPESYGWAVWVGAAPWMAQHFWWHYLYSGDKAFLAEKAYPYFREIASFYEDYCVAGPDGIQQIMPSQSPENRFAGTGHFPVSLGISAAMDVQLAYDALSYAIRAAGILEQDEEDARRWQKLRDSLPPFSIGSDGRLLEWDIEREEVEPGHRHLSHLYGLYPSDLFNPAERPAEFSAALKSLDSRLSHGGGHTGWSRAWVACLSARAGRGDAFREHLSGLVTDFATETLLDLHPPRIFQIEGNMGAAAALYEALAQYWGGCLHLLRALPRQWPSGSVAGLHVQGGHQISFSWQNAQLAEISVILGHTGSLNLAGPGLQGVKRIQGTCGEEICLQADAVFN